MARSQRAKQLLPHALHDFACHGHRRSELRLQRRRDVRGSSVSQDVIGATMTRSIFFALAIVCTACGSSSAVPTDGESQDEMGGAAGVGAEVSMAGAGVGGAGGAASAGASGSAGHSIALDAGAATSSKWVAVDHNHQAIWMKAAPHVNRI